MRTGMFAVFGVFSVFAGCFAGLLGLAGLASGSAVYRTVDAAGNPLFSDRPLGPDAVVVDIGPVNTLSASPAPRSEDPRSAKPQSKGQPRVDRNTASVYRLLEIASPEDGATFRDPHQPIPINVRLQPALRVGDKIQLLDNGAVLDGRVLDAPDRGLHLLLARVVDAAGKVVMRSAPVSVQVHRTAVDREKKASLSGPEPATRGAAARPFLVH